MKTRRKFLSLGLAALFLLALLGLIVQPLRAAAAPYATMDWYYLGGSGGSFTSGGLSLDSTLGQSVSGRVSSDVCIGFECGLMSWMSLYLATIYR